MHLIGDVISADQQTVYCDSQAAIASTKDPKYHSKTKQIDIKFNYIRYGSTCESKRIIYLQKKNGCKSIDLANS